MTSHHTKKTSHKKILIDRIITAYKRSQYYTAIRLLVSTSQPGKDALQRLVRTLVHTEMLAYLQSDSSKQFPHLKGLKDIEHFSWVSMLDQLSSAMPILHPALDGAMPRCAAGDERLLRLIIHRPIHFLTSQSHPAQSGHCSTQLFFSFVLIRFSNKIIPLATKFSCNI